MTEYVLKKAPCRVLLTAPPEDPWERMKRSRRAASEPAAATPVPRRRQPRAGGPQIARWFLFVRVARRLRALVRIVGGPGTMLREGHEVSCLDEDPEAHARLEVNLERSWEDVGGQFTVGTGLEIDALLAAGIEQADAFIASTDGDNTNIIIAQIAKRRFNVPTVIARILDPLRAEWYEKQGREHDLPDPGRDRDARGGGPGGARAGGRRRRSGDGRGQCTSSSSGPARWDGTSRGSCSTRATR